MNRPIPSKLVLCLLSALFAAQAPAQMVRSHGGGGQNDVVFIHELGLVAGVVPGSDRIEVLMLMPDTERDVTIKKGDLVLMANGKPVRELAELRTLYDGAAVGDTVKLGLRRGDERFLSSFEKKEPQAGGQGVRMVVGGPGTSMGDVLPMPEFGVLLGERDGAITVAMELPTGDAGLKENDVVKSINGRPVATLAELREVYAPLDVGTDVELRIVRGGREIAETRAKKDSEGMIRMRSSH